MQNFQSSIYLRWYVNLSNIQSPKELQKRPAHIILRFTGPGICVKVSFFFLHKWNLHHSKRLPTKDRGQENTFRYSAIHPTRHIGLLQWKSVLYRRHVRRFLAISRNRNFYANSRSGKSEDDVHPSIASSF